jgi:hypothetical protein
MIGFDFLFQETLCIKEKKEREKQTAQSGVAIGCITASIFFFM